jgi:hypothetical protein
MEKQLSAVGYWLGLVCTVIGVFLRFLYFFGYIPPHMGPPGGNSFSYLTFLHGAVLFFLLGIASWSRTQQS